MQQISTQEQQDENFEQKQKKLYYALLLTPLVMISVLMLSIYFIPSFQTVFLSFFSECSNHSLIGQVGLSILGITMIVLMMPFAFYELAIGFACSNYALPILMITCAKIVGESISFYFGRKLTPVLKPILREFKFFQAIEILTQQNPFKTQLLMRMSGITPQLIMNYGMGVLGDVKFSSFLLVANITGIPNTVLSVFIAKQFNRIKDVFSEGSVAEKKELIDLELGLCILGGLSVAALFYYVTKEYQKILSKCENEIVSLKQNENADLEATVESLGDIELAHAI